jgi:trigger factor
MHSQIDQISPILVEVKVEVPWTKVSESLEVAYRNLQRTARVRGFRPGKVPRNVVKNLMGKNVERDVSSQLVEEGLGEAVKQHALEPVSVSQMDSPALAQGQAFSFTAKLEVKPKIDKVDTSSLVVQRTVESVGDADITRELEQLREQNAEIVALTEPRPAREGDILTLDIDVSVEGQHRADLSSTDTRAELGGERLLAEIEAGLESANVGEEREVNLTFGDDYGHEALRGKPARFKIRVKQIQQKVLPELDDELAKDLEHESLEALRTDVRKRLTEAGQRRAESQLREQVVERLIDVNPVPVPPSLVERQERAMLAELYQLQQMLGRPIPFDEEMHAQMHERAERKIRAMLVLAALAEQQEIAVGDDEVEAKLKELAEQSGKHIAKVKAEYQGDRRDTLHSQLLHNRLLEYLLTQATITDAKVPEAAEVKPAKAGVAAKADASAQKAAAPAKSKEAPIKPKSKEAPIKPKSKETGSKPKKPQASSAKTEKADKAKKTEKADKPKKTKGKG